MNEKNYDDYFEEKSDSEKPQESLLKMINTMKTDPEMDFREGQKVSGAVVSIGKDNLFVDIGGKNEACIKVAEFTDENGAVSVKPGDTIQAFVIAASENEITLSKSISGQRGETQSLIDLMKNRAPVQGKITGINKGGFNVNIMGKRAFCPVSHIDLKYVEDPNVYLSRSLTFVISRITEGGRNIVLSRLPLLENEMEAELDEIIRTVESKKVYKGTVTRIADFGLFVDIGSVVEGLVHVSEVSWDRTENLAESYSKGQKIDCIVLKVEKKEPLRNSKISLSIRQVTDNPWTHISETLQIGQSVQGTITRLENFGAFVQLLPGIEGLIHVSEMRWGERVNHPSDVVKVGDSVRVTIKGIDPAKRSVSCTLKDIADDPWNGVAASFPVGAQVSGTVASKVKFGFFIDLAPGVTGLLALPNIAADKKAVIKVGDVLPVDIRSVDLETRKISLSSGIEVTVKNEAETRKFLEKQKVEQTKPSSEFGEMLKSALKKKAE
jgi:small subunit ribosomal protein S1